MPKPLPYELHAYDRARHGAFVELSWATGARRQRRELRDLLRRPDVRCVVAAVPGSPDDLLGWAAVQGDAVIWAYTRHLVRRRGLGTDLVTGLGIDVTRPFPCLFWSRALTSIALMGAYRPVYAPPEERQ